MRTVKIGFIGCGRMGKLHMTNLINAVPGAEVIAVSDPYIDTNGGREWCVQHNIPSISDNYQDVLNNPEVEAVFVCSSTDAHCPMSLASVKAGKHTFCEKPITYDVPQILELQKAIEEAGVKFMVGFNRRFDHNHRAVAEAVKRGDVGAPHIVSVSSRDPEPPTMDYVAVSGGLFYDMMIHDFDMVRYVTGAEALEISAVGACLVNPKLQEESGIPDVDTAVVTMKMDNGCIAVINNSRQAVYGYDQRVEVFGSEGCAQDENDIPNTAVLSTAGGTVSGTAYKIMWDRYTGAFVSEMQAFADAVINDKEPPVTGEDGLYPVLMAAAATKSLHEGRPVKLSELA